MVAAAWLSLDGYKASLSARATRMLAPLGSTWAQMLGSSWASMPIVRAIDIASAVPILPYQEAGYVLFRMI